MKTVGIRLPLWFMGKTHKASERHLFMVKIRVVANDRSLKDRNVDSFNFL